MSPPPGAVDVSILTSLRLLFELHHVLAAEARQPQNVLQEQLLHLILASFDWGQTPCCLSDARR